MEMVTLTIAALTLLLLLTLYGSQQSRLGGIENKLNALLAHQGVNPTLRLPLSERVKELAADRQRKIEAIKTYREETGAGLAEAKEAIEVYTQNHFGFR